MVTIPFALVAIKLLVDDITIFDVQKKVDIAKTAKPEEQSKLYSEAQLALESLISGDKLKSGSDFRTAAALFEVPNRFFEGVRVRYELNLTALRLDDAVARKSLPAVWDELVISLGRNQRFGFGNDSKISYPGLYRVISAPKGVTQFWRDAEASVRRAKSSKDSKEIEAIMAADQKARDQDWSKLKPKDFELIAKGDAQRLAQIKKLVAKGNLTTAADYFNAALVCQHGGEFDDYALAHELSVISMILGAKSGSWLAAASYDRMLLNMGHRQRFGTQYYMVGGKTLLSPIDETMMNETQRFTVGRRKLSEIRAKGYGG
ncbi:MAG: hypothetical protein WCK51_08200 [Armatimonadota bacterium]